MEISFHIPNTNTQFVGDENQPSAQVLTFHESYMLVILFRYLNIWNKPSVQVFRDKIVSMADVGAGGEEAVVTFDGIAILTPR